MKNLPRGLHTNHRTTEIIFPISGSFAAKPTNGITIKKFHLNRDNQELVVPNYIWLTMDNFSPDCIIFVACNRFFDETECIRDYKDYLNEMQKKREKTHIDYFDLGKQTHKIRHLIDSKIQDIIYNSQFVLGEDLKDFENVFAKYNSIKHCVGVSNGTSAVTIVLKSLGLALNDFVLVQSNTFIATPLTIEQCGLQTQVIDVDKNLNLDLKALESTIRNNPNVKAVIVVHLYGMCPDMDVLMSLKKKYGFYLIEDAAQAHGSTFNGRKLGTFGDIGYFSFYPGKKSWCFW